MRKFLDVDILPALQDIMERITESYQSDFEYDKEKIIRYAQNPDYGDEVLLWMARSSGTWCLPESAVFLKDTFEHNTWRFYAEQSIDNILAFAVIPREIDGDTVRGDLYQLNYLEHAKRVERLAISYTGVNLTFEDGNTRHFTAKEYSANWELIVQEFGKIQKTKYEPPTPREFHNMLCQEQRLRSSFRPQNLDSFIKLLDKTAPAESLHVKLGRAKQEAKKAPANQKSHTKGGQEL